MGCTNRPGHPGNFIQGSYTPNSKKELEEYKKLHYNRYHARIITPDGLCFICEAHKNISEAIGRYIGRSIYNGIKHQGIIHYEGLGANFTEVSISINGKTPPMLHRKSYTVEEIEELMFAYHKKFKDYVDVIISVIIPEGYLETKVDFETAINEIAKMNKSAE